MLKNAASALYSEFRDGGFARIESACQDNESESAYLDFKVNKDKGATTSRLTEDSRGHLARCISAFANTSGGILVWGVDAKDHKANELDPIPDITTFVQNLNTHTGGSTEPPVIGVEHFPIEHPGPGGGGYVVTFVPDSPNKPHQCVAQNKLKTYFMRSGSNCDPMPHSYVQAFILSKARPELTLELRFCGVGTTMNGSRVTTYTASYDLLVSNTGSTLAEDVAIAIEAIPMVNLALPSIREIVLKWPNDSFSARLTGILFGQPIYPGTEMIAGKLHYLFTELVQVGNFVRPRKGFEFRYALFGRDIAQSGTVTVSREQIDL